MHTYIVEELVQSKIYSHVCMFGYLCMMYVIVSPLYDVLGDCIVDNHGRLRGPPQSISRPGAEDRLGESGDELAERLSDEGENIRRSGVEKILAMHGAQDLLQRFWFT